MTASVPTSRLGLRAVDVTIGSRCALRLGPGNGEPPLLLELELLRPVDEARSFWRVSARGPHATLVKAEAKQWSRLLRERGPDNKQSVDWGRWSHPEVTRAADREAKRDEFARRSHARQKEARGELMPRAQDIFDEWREAQDREWEKGAALAPTRQRELLEVGEQILEMYTREREESVTLLGDAPRKKDEREEEAERLVAQLKSLRRKASSTRSAHLGLGRVPTAAEAPKEKAAEEKAAAEKAAAEQAAAAKAAERAAGGRAQKPPKPKPAGRRRTTRRPPTRTGTRCGEDGLG